MSNVYGCHSDKAPHRCKSSHVVHSGGRVFWRYVFTRACQYDQRANDDRCNGCKHEHVADKKPVVVVKNSKGEPIPHDFIIKQY